MQHFDVVILGAGPAGAATALALRKSQPHLSVMMVEPSEFQSLRPGEILTREAIPILQQFDVFDFFLEQNHPEVSIHSAGPGELATASNLLSGSSGECGWHVDRARFDSMLAGYAAASGASFVRANMSEVHFLADDSWQITAQSPVKSHSLNASLVVDATGRSARFATEIGVPQIAHDTLVGVVRIIGLEHNEQAGNGPLIEPFEHGWWYSTPISENRLAVIAMTDADINKQLKLAHIAQWTEHMQTATLTRERVANLKIMGDLCVRASHTRCLHNSCGKNWLAVGDAATSVDPISSQGIIRALRFGMHASDAIGWHFNREPNSLENYETLVQAEFENTLNLRAEIYRSESRWKNAPFWLRRQTTPNFPPSGWPQRKSTLSISNSKSGDGARPLKQNTAVRTQ